MTLPAVIASARAESDERRVLGFDQAALEEAEKQGLAAGIFEESEEEGAAVIEEFSRLRMKSFQLATRSGPAKGSGCRTS